MSSNSEYMTGIPSTPSTVTDSWQPLVAQVDQVKPGNGVVSLGNWDATTTKPTVLTGSWIEAAGALIRVTADETITDDTGLASGTCYLVVDFSGTDPDWVQTNDAPVWNAALGGFYDAASGTVTRKYTGHMWNWDGSSAYSYKQFVNDLSLFPVSAGSNVLVSYNYTISITGTSYVKKYEIETAIPGVMTISFDLKTSSSTYTAYARIYKNGSALGAEQSNDTTAYITKTENLEFDIGDTIEIWMKATAAATVYIANIEIGVGEKITNIDRGLFGFNNAQGLIE